MRVLGQRVRRTKWIHTLRYVIAVEVELVVPAEDPSEPCYEAETVKLLKEVKARAEQGDLDW
ncbi:MAG: hypothetical protein WD872_07515 [Pirellulaceae bacterium]